MRQVAPVSVALRTGTLTEGLLFCCHPAVRAPASASPVQPVGRCKHEQLVKEAARFRPDGHAAFCRRRGCRRRGEQGRSRRDGQEGRDLHQGAERRTRPIRKFTGKAAKFVDRDLYVVVYQLDGKVLAHGSNAKFVGKDLSDAQDVDGKLYVKERVELATKQPSFWQDYKFVNPVSKKVEPKEMYCEKVEKPPCVPASTRSDTRRGSPHRRPIAAKDCYVRLDQEYRAVLEGSARAGLPDPGPDRRRRLCLASAAVEPDRGRCARLRPGGIGIDERAQHHCMDGHAKLYRLAAIAANETDEKKVAAFAKETSAAAARILDALKAMQDAQGEAKSGSLEKLKAAVAGYLKQSRNAIEMADGDAGSALLFIKGAERNFAEIEKLTDDLIARSCDSKDREIARAGMKLEQQQLTLLIVLAGRGIRRHRRLVPDRPEHFPSGGRDVERHARTRRRQLRCPPAGPRPT